MADRPLLLLALSRDVAKRVMTLIAPLASDVRLRWDPCPSEALLQAAALVVGTPQTWGTAPSAVILDPDDPALVATVAACLERWRAVTSAPSSTNESSCRDTCAAPTDPAARLVTVADFGSGSDVALYVAAASARSATTLLVDLRARPTIDVLHDTPRHLHNAIQRTPTRPYATLSPSGELLEDFLSPDPLLERSAAASLVRRWELIVVVVDPPRRERDPSDTHGLAVRGLWQASQAGVLAGTASFEGRFRLIEGCIELGAATTSSWVVVADESLRRARAAIDALRSGLASRLARTTTLEFAAIEGVRDLTHETVAPLAQRPIECLLPVVTAALRAAPRPWLRNVVSASPTTPPVAVPESLAELYRIWEGSD